MNYKKNVNLYTDREDKLFFKLCEIYTLIKKRSKLKLYKTS